MERTEDLWTAVSQLLRAQVSDAVWYSTFNDVHSLPGDDTTLRLAVPSGTVRDKITSRYLPLVLDALTEIGAGSTQLDVEVVSNDASGEVVQESTPQPTANAPVSKSASSEAAAADKAEEMADRAGLNPRYTFETFVKGASNSFALAAAQRVAETPARSYNPLFIYGSAGLGKTHLLHAIGHYVLQNYNDYQVRYISTETFLNEYVDGIRNNTIANFKRRYRDIDVLLIDDIQFMEGKEGLQEEFFHTFNSLHGANKQIVISSDRVPDAIPNLEERLVGRFRWGLITDVQPPDLETRLAILRNKAEREGTVVPGDVLEYIASRVTSNIRELEGALIRVSAYSSLNRVDMTVPQAERLLEDLLPSTAPKHRTDQELLTEIAGLLGFAVDALRGKSRQRPLVMARQEAMYVFRELTDLSYPAIARLFGGRDHTTVIHAVDKITRLMAERSETYDRVTMLVKNLKLS
ncbi:MAG: chromosomal replication initiator protein DnaA [actinobacterium acAcidi]|nr:MAG: chromosomal replication initiator protein DnaA [actinobacterium acAcidi]